MLQLLLDENISPKVVRCLKQRNPQIVVRAVLHFEHGRNLSKRDDELLEIAYVTRLTLVTYDLSTIVPILKDWGEQGRHHAGVILIDDRTLPSSSFGQLALSLEQIWKEQHELDWTVRVIFLDAPRGFSG